MSVLGFAFWLEWPYSGYKLYFYLYICAITGYLADRILFSSLQGGFIAREIENPPSVKKRNQTNPVTPGGKVITGLVPGVIQTVFTS